MRCGSTSMAEVITRLRRLTPTANQLQVHTLERLVPVQQTPRLFDTGSGSTEKAFCTVQRTLNNANVPHFMLTSPPCIKSTGSVLMFILSALLRGIQITPDKPA